MSGGLGSIGTLCQKLLKPLNFNFDLFVAFWEFLFGKKSEQTHLVALIMFVFYSKVLVSIQNSWIFHSYHLQAPHFLLLNIKTANFLQLRSCAITSLNFCFTDKWIEELLRVFFVEKQISVMKKSFTKAIFVIKVILKLLNKYCAITFLAYKIMHENWRRKSSPKVSD